MDDIGDDERLVENLKLRLFPHFPIRYLQSIFHQVLIRSQPQEVYYYQTGYSITRVSPASHPERLG